jgi:hypothetical protein
MKKTNDSYCVVFEGKRTTERYYRDRDGWPDVSSRGRAFRMTAEQVLNPPATRPRVRRPVGETDKEDSRAQRR